jgi:hypothetical protein
MYVHVYIQSYPEETEEEAVKIMEIPVRTCASGLGYENQSTKRCRDTFVYALYVIPPYFDTRSIRM